MRRLVALGKDDDGFALVADGMLLAGSQDGLRIARIMRQRVAEVVERALVLIEPQVNEPGTNAGGKCKT